MGRRVYIHRCRNRRMTLKEYDDQDLIILAQDGNKQAFGVLVERYMKRAYFVALGFVGTEEDALDLSQDAFVRAYRAIKRFERGRRFFTWFYHILRNLCFNFIRDRKKRAYPFSQVSDHVILQLCGEESGCPDNILVKKEQSAHLWNAIQKLTEIEKEVIILREFQELSYQEISQILNCPIGTVMSRLYNARKHLAELMRGEL